MTSSVLSPEHTACITFKKFLQLCIKTQVSCTTYPAALNFKVFASFTYLQEECMLSVSTATKTPKLNTSPCSCKYPKSSGLHCTIVLSTSLAKTEWSVVGFRCAFFTWFYPCIKTIKLWMKCSIACCAGRARSGWETAVTVSWKSRFNWFCHLALQWISSPFQKYRWN